MNRSVIMLTSLGGCLHELEDDFGKTAQVWLFDEVTAALHEALKK